MLNLTAHSAFRAIFVKLPAAGPSIPCALSVSHPAFVQRASASTYLDRPGWDALSRIRVAQPSGGSATQEVPPLTPEEVWADRSDRFLKMLAPPKNAYAGRSVPVRGGNVAEALGNLNTVLRRNRVFSELRAMARHEKKGEKRRRLSSERWRRQFAHEVRKKVALVKAIRARGA